MADAPAPAPTPDNKPHSHAFILQRKTGEIEIRAASPERLRDEMDKFAVTHAFNDPVKHHETLHGVTGVRKAEG